MCRTQAVHLIQENTSQNTEKNTAGGKKRRHGTALGGSDVLQLIWKQYPAACLCDPHFQERLSVRSQHGAVSLNMMTVIVSKQARCDLHICSNNTEEGCGL